MLATRILIDLRTSLTRYLYNKAETGKRKKFGYIAINVHVKVVILQGCLICQTPDAAIMKRSKHIFVYQQTLYSDDA